MPKPFLLLIAANLDLAWCWGWKLSLRPVLAWLAAQQSKNCTFTELIWKYQWYEILPTCLHHTQPHHSHFCCWLLPIWAKLYFWAENWAHGLCQIGHWYNRGDLSSSWPFIIVSMIWNTSELSASHLSHPTAIFVVDACQFGPRWMFGWKWSLLPVSTWLELQRTKLYLPWPYMIVLIIWNNSEMSALQLSHTTVNFVVDCCQFEPR